MLSGELSLASSKQSDGELQRFPWGTGPFHSSLQTGSIAALSALIRPLSQSIWMEPQTRDAQKRSWLLALLQLKNSSRAEGMGGKGDALFPVEGEMQPKDIPDLQKLYQCTESTHLLTEGGRRGWDRLGFERSYSISKSSGQI